MATTTAPNVHADLARRQKAEEILAAIRIVAESVGRRVNAALVASLDAGERRRYVAIVSAQRKIAGRGSVDSASPETWAIVEALAGPVAPVVPFRRDVPRVEDDSCPCCHAGDRCACSFDGPGDSCSTHRPAPIGDPPSVPSSPGWCGCGGRDCGPGTGVIVNPAEAAKRERAHRTLCLVCSTPSRRWCATCRYRFCPAHGSLRLCHACRVPAQAAPEDRRCAVCEEDVARGTGKRDVLADLVMHDACAPQYRRDAAEADKAQRDARAGRI